jgi:isoleucyl-tRNA synthetase
MCSALCESGDSQPNSVQLTLGELLFDYRAYVLKKHPQAEHNTVHRKTHKIERINRLIEKIINSFFHSTEKNPCFRLRAYRLMALYYSEAHQNNDRWSEHCAEQAVRALLQAYESYNAQNGPCHMFWLQEK